MGWLDSNKVCLRQIALNALVLLCVILAACATAQPTTVATTIPIAPGTLTAVPLVSVVPLLTETRTGILPTSAPPPTRTLTPIPSPTPFKPSVKVIGTEEMVYDWGRDHCANGGMADLPVRAFRDADGLIQLNLSFTTNFRMIGKDFDSLRTDCQVTIASDLDPDPAHFNYSEWMGSTYTLDGKAVYALIHNEWYGDEASRWFARRDFGPSQGGGDWYYRSWNGSHYGDMRFDDRNNRWQGSDPLCQIGPGWAHPDRGCQPDRTWVSPVDATVTISGIAGDLDPGGGDGVIVEILKGDAQIWSATIDNGDTKDYPFDLQVPVIVGDAIHFRVNARGNTNNDTTYLNPKINVGLDPCRSGKRGQCTMYALTFAQSTDGGNTFTHSPAPSHLVASMPYRYQPDGGMFGNWQPSNIVKNPKDGYYYAMIQLDDNRTGRPWLQGMCVMRTKTLDDPTSWRAWDGKGFDRRFINPYTETVADPEKQVCQVVSLNEVGSLSYNLTYSSYFDKFIAAGVAVNERVPGFYFSLSDDLVHWTPKQLIMPADSVHNTGGKTPYLAYPSLIDPQDTSRNFEVVGASPYMYFSRFNKGWPLEIDLVRVRVQFSK